MLTKLFLYFHTIRYLRFIQIKYRIFYWGRKRIRRLIGFNYPKQQLPTDYPRIHFEESLAAAAHVQFKNNHFSFLNLAQEYANGIDWNDQTHGKLWTYNLNYFEFLHLPNLSKEDGLELIYNFIHQIEKSKDGIEPYPISLRVIHWVKFLVKHNITDPNIDQSLFNQVWILRDNCEFHLLGNHLLENGFALLFGAYYFKNELLYQKAKAILAKELEEQVLLDGAHFELSPMYHQLMLYRVLDCYQLVKYNKLFNQELLTTLQNKASIMLGWLLQMTFQNGDIPLVNDSAFSINPTTKDLLEYAKRLGITSILKPLKESGYRKITFPLYECILDIGSIGPDYIPGHAHSDTFNFILYAKGNPFIIDTGISTYNPTERRNIERSTQAHNTVQINNYEQSEIWASFRVARRTVPKVLEETNNRYKASLDFATAKGLTHQRLFSFAENGMIIKDEVNVKDTSKAYLHFHPNVSASINGQEIVTNYGRIKVSNTCDVTLEKYQYAPTFNQLIPAKRAVITFTEFTTVTIEL